MGCSFSYTFLPGNPLANGIQGQGDEVDVDAHLRRHFFCLSAKQTVTQRKTTSPNILKNTFTYLLPLFASGGMGASGPKQYRNPSCAFIVLACKLQRHGKRYAQNNTDQTKKASPKDQREKYDQRGQAKPPTHEPRLNHVTEYETYDQISDSGERGTADPELDEGENNRGNRGDDSTDIRYIMEEKGQETPENGRIYAEDGEP